MRDYVKCHLNDGGEKIMLRCDVCEGLVDLDDTICKKCGFDNHIIPDDASPEIQEIERKRIEAAKKVAEALAKEQTAHNKTKTALENEKTAHEETKSDLAIEQTEHNKTKAALKKEQTAHEETKSDLATEQTAHNRTKTALKNEKAAHEETKSNLANEKDAHMQTKKKLDDAIKNPPTPPRPVPNKKVIGKALFTQGGRSEAVDLYEGGCRVTAPAWTNVKGELFEIICDNGMYFLRDLSGSMYNRHEREISSLVTVRNKDAFRIGELIIKLSFPKQ
jgi:hypothetical protein